MSTSTATQTPQKPQGWRFKLGVAMIAMNLVVPPVVVGLLALTNLPTQQKAAASAIVFVGLPKVFTVLAIVLLGKAGFRRLMGLALGKLKAITLVQTPGPVRYFIGMVMFLGTLLLSVAAPYLDKYVPGWLPQETSLALIGDLVFAVSFLVLGGDFWDKVCALFVRGATVSFPVGETPEADGSRG